MARDFRIPGETLVKVKGRGAFDTLATSIGDPGLRLFELGLADRNIVIIPRWHHSDMLVDDFGPFVPADVMWMLSDCLIEMHLIHYDNAVLEACYAESMGGSGVGADGNHDAGIMASAGTPMGGWIAAQSTGNHYMSLSLLCPALGFNWRFPTSYLTTMPLKIPVGTKASIVELHWRAIPYTVPLEWSLSMSPGSVQNREVVSINKTLWDHQTDSSV